MKHCLPDNLRTLRASKRLYQKDVVDDILKMGFFIPRSSYSNYERGDCEPHIEALKALADYHELSMDDLCYTKFSVLDYEKIETCKNNFRNRKQTT